MATSDPAATVDQRAEGEGRGDCEGEGWDSESEGTDVCLDG